MSQWQDACEVRDADDFSSHDGLSVMSTLSKVDVVGYKPEVSGTVVVSCVAVLVWASCDVYVSWRGFAGLVWLGGFALLFPVVWVWPCVGVWPAGQFSRFSGLAGCCGSEDKQTHHHRVEDTSEQRSEHAPTAFWPGLWTTYEGNSRQSLSKPIQWVHSPSWGDEVFESVHKADGVRCDIDGKAVATSNIDLRVGLGHPLPARPQVSRVLGFPSLSKTNAFFASCEATVDTLEHWHFLKLPVYVPFSDG